MRMRLPRLAAAAALLLAARAAAHVEEWGVDTANAGRFVCRPMYARAAIPGGDEAFINIDIVRPAGQASGAVSVVVFNAEDRDFIGYMENDERYYICDRSAITAGTCKPENEGKFVVQPSNKYWTHIETKVVRFGSEQRYSFRYVVDLTGEYCVDIYNLEGDSASGVIEWRNPYGELPAVEYPKLPFYGMLSLAYLAYGLAWMALSLKYPADLLPLQNFIGGVIAFLAVEIAFNYGYYENYNKYGTSSTFLLILVIVLNSARNSVSFFLLLIVSLGYGVVRPTLGSKMKECLTLSYAHFVCNTVYVAGSMLAQDLRGPLVFLFVFPLAGTLTAFYVWTFNGITETMRRLELRRQVVKIRMYKILYRVLIFSLINLFVFLVANIVDAAHRSDWAYYSRVWQWKWFLVDGWLNLLYFIVLTMVLVLWRPTANNLRYGLEEIPDDDEEGSGAGGGKSARWSKSNNALRSEQTMVMRNATRESDESAALAAPLAEVVFDLDGAGSEDGTVAENKHALATDEEHDLLRWASSSLMEEDAAAAAADADARSKMK